MQYVPDKSGDYKYSHPSVTAYYLRITETSKKFSMGIGLALAAPICRHAKIPPLCKGRLGGVEFAITLPPLPPPYEGGGPVFCDHN